VLVVDDDPAVRGVLRGHLARDGWEVRESDNGRAALERIAERVPSVVLLDLMMPEMDGFEVVEALRANEAWQGIPVVVLTAKDVTAADRERLAGSVNRIVLKGAGRTEESLRAACGVVREALRPSGAAE
jgi:CheY-like chemotaxis protein